MQFLTLSTGTTHPEAAEPLVQFGMSKQSNGRRRYFGDTPTIMGSAVYVNVTHANTREEYMYIMNWRTGEALLASTIISNHWLAILIDPLDNHG